MYTISVTTEQLWGKVERAVEREDPAETSAALRRVLRQVVPEAHDSTEPRYHHPNPAAALRWLGIRGHLTLRVEVVGWHRYVVTLWDGRPGITAKPTLLFRDATPDVYAVQGLIGAAIRHAR